MSEKNEMDKSRILTLKDFIAGTVAGWFQVLFSQPFDIIKVRLQAQSNTNPHYLSFSDCVKKIAFEEGPKTFYIGSLSPLIGNGLCISIVFGTNEALKRYFKLYKKKQELSNMELAS